MMNNMEKNLTVRYGLKSPIIKRNLSENKFGEYQVENFDKYIKTMKKQ